MLELEGVSRSFGRRRVLNAIDAVVAADERVMVRGANGSGKTTLLRIAAGALRPTSGSVRVAGATGAAARKHLAFVPHDAPVYRELSAAEHLRFGARMHGRTLTHGDAAVALRDAGLAKLSQRPAHHLSRGQRQRLALATAFAMKPALLILDEPMTALDELGRDWLRGRLDTFQGAIVAAVHQDSLTADRALELRDGGLA